MSCLSLFLKMLLKRILKLYGLQTQIASLIRDNLSDFAEDIQIQVNKALKVVCNVLLEKNKQVV